MKVFPEQQFAYQGGTWAVGLTSGSNVIGAVTQSGSWAVSVSNWPSTYAATQSGSWSVEVSNLPATQPVSVATIPSHAVTNVGTFAVQVSSAPTTAVTGTFYQATQPVSNAGTFAVQVTSAPSTVVTGTFWQATQPVSISSVPLPTGAATESTLSTLSGHVTKCDTDNVTLVDASARPGWSKANLVGAATTTVKSGAGVLHSIVINRSALSGTITIYDNTAGSGTKIGTITYGALTLLTDPPISALYDASFSTGLTIVTVGANLDLTIMYR